MFSTKLMKAILAIPKNILSTGKDALECIEVNDGIATVTDGHRLYQFPAKDEIDGMYHCKSVDVATKIATAQKCDMKVSSVEPKTDPPQYPQCDRLFPNYTGNPMLLMNAKYLRDLCDLAISGHPKGMIEFYIPDANPDSGNIESVVVVHFLVGDDSVARGITMPLQRRDGIRFEYKGRESAPLLSTGKAAPKKREKVAA